MSTLRRAAAVVAAALALSGIGAGAATSASAVQVQQDRVVSPTPGTNTPNIANDRVEEITQVGNKVIVGGGFTSASNRGSTTTLTRNRILAFDATTGVIDTGFAPSLNDRVYALLPGPMANTVYVGGAFTTFNGAASKKLLLLDTDTGAPVPGFAPPALNGIVNDIKRLGNRLFVGGSFGKAGALTRTGLVTLNATTGAVDSFMSVQLAGHHNFAGSTCPSPPDPNNACGPIGINKLDINPAGTRLVAIGNFKTVNGTDRDQVFMADISGATATLADWRTDRYDSRCFSGAYDSWIRDVDFSPDGTYFVIVATGGYPLDGTNLCDSAARWETAATTSGTGASLDPTWVDWTGGDTLHSVAVTGAAVYVGGHQRWLNNYHASDSAGPGAVPRPGIAALDPVNGLPLPWNPGRNPRGAGAYALFASQTGLYVGSDTDVIGVGTTRTIRKKIAFFPLAGGSARRADNTGTLPGTVYQTGRLVSPQPYNVLYRINAGGPALQSVDAGPNWTADDQAANPLRNTGSNSATWSPSAARGAALPDSAPTALFDSERWDPGAAPEMQWHLQVPTNTPLRIRLFFANRCSCTSGVAKRKFSVQLDGAAMLTSYDIVADAGDQTGTMKQVTVPSEPDGSVDLTFVHQVENPLINGIEVARTDQADPPLVAAGADDLLWRTFDGSKAGPLSSSATPNAAWHRARGAFMVDGTLFYGWNDGTLHKRTFDGTTFGPDVLVDPYHNTPWENVDTGSGQTYAGNVPGLYGEMGNVTSMFYARGRLYYTLTGSTNLYDRYFTPESGIVGSQEFTTTPGGVDWSDVAGAFLDTTHGVLYFAKASDGKLYSVNWTDSSPIPGQPVAGRPAGPVTIANASTNWGTRGMFLLAP